MKFNRGEKVEYRDRDGEVRMGRIVDFGTCRTDETITAMAIVESFYDDRISVPLDEIGRIVPLRCAPVVISPLGRFRPPYVQAPKQDPAARQKAKLALTRGAKHMLECLKCGDLFKPFDLVDHPCEGGIPADVAAGGSATFGVAKNQRFPDLGPEEW